MTEVFDLEKDGISHINVYSKAKTGLGLFLSNFTKCDLETDEGDFCSVEAYWYWLSAPDTPERDVLRTLWGWEAKKTGRKIRGPDYDADNDLPFQDKIKKVLRYKIVNSRFKNEFARSTLPFAHYYVYNDKCIVPTSGVWQIEYFEQLRKELHGSVPIMQTR